MLLLTSLSETGISFKKRQKDNNVNGRFYARDVNVISDAKAVSRRLKRLVLKRNIRQMPLTSSFKSV